MDTFHINAVEATDPAGVTNSTTAEPQPRARINQNQGDWLTHAEQFLANARSDSEIVAYLQLRGYNAAKLAQGQALVAASRSAVNVRQNALAEQKLAKDTLTFKHAVARREYSNFRIIARSILSTEDAAAALLLDERQVTGVRRFIHMAHITYQTTLERPAYIEALALAGYTQEDIRALDDQIDELADAFDAHRNARAQLHQTRLRRDDAIKQATQWVMRFRNVARVAVRERPDLAARLGIRPL